MKYTIRPNNEYFSPILTKGEIVHRNKENDEVIDFLKDRPMPGTGTIIRVLKDVSNNRPIINIDQEDLNEAVKAFAFYDKASNKPILNADVTFGMDYFWNVPDLSWEIPNIGTTINVQEFKTTPIDSFWFSVAEVDPRFWINDGKHERPENMSSVLFIITPMYMDEDKKDVSRLGKDTKISDVLNISRIVIKMDRDRKMYVLDAAGILYEEKANDDTLERLIFECLEMPENYRVVGQEFDQFVSEIAKYNEQEFDIHGVIKSAIKAGIVEMKNTYYYFEDKPLGYTVNEAVNNLYSAKMAGTLKKIRTALKNAD